MVENLQIKRVYEPPGPRDGQRILVDRIWPRGLSKEKAAVDLWLKDVAPSTELRKWFGHDVARWPEFRTRYRKQLKQLDDAIEELRELAAKQKVTLLFGASDTEHNQAVVLAEYLRGD